MAPVTTSNIKNMAFRGGNRRSGGGGGSGGSGGGGFSGGNYGGGSGGAMGGGRVNPWDSTSSPNYGGIRQGGGGGVMHSEALTLANNIINNLLRSRNPPSLLDLPGGGGSSMGGNRGPRGQMGNRAGNRNRRVQGNFGRGGPKAGAQKQGGGIRKQNAFDRAKKLLAKNSTKKKDNSAPDDKTDKKKNESEKESIYADVPNDMFYCHLCKKHMWDATSFENHIKGRTHLMMREGIEESYRLKANMIRQEAKIAEQLKLIELDRLKRMGKSKAHQREYCTMCDLNFHGHLSAHRKTEGHLALKKFLHPKCVECSKEFPTRIEYDTHLLTPEHLKKAAERNTKVGERKKNTLTILTEEDEIKDVRQPQKKKKKVEPKKEGEGGEGTTEGGEKKENGEGGEDAEPSEAVEGGEEEKKEGEEGGEQKEEEEEEDPNATLIEDPDDCILDYHDGDEVPSEIDSRIPKYNCQRPVGTSLISKLVCFECAVCCKFFDNEKTAEIHSRTVTHHRHFIKFLNEKASDTKIAQKRAAAALEENERKKRKLEEREAADKEDESTENMDNTENGEEGEGGDGEDKTNDELYDPSEATGDDEEQDAEMNESSEMQDIEDRKEEVNGKVEDIEMKEEIEIKEEPQQQNEIIQPEIKEEKIETKAVSPQKQAAATPKNVPNRQAQAKGTPRSRGRGRYNRY